MKKPYREHHLTLALKGFSLQTLPLDLYLNHYFRAHKALGSNDRAYLSDTLYALIRWQGLLDGVSSPPYTFEKRLDAYQKHTLEHMKELRYLPPHVRVSFPEWLFNKMKKQFGEEKAKELCLILNEQAPITIRANLLKTTRDELLTRLKMTCDVRASNQSPNAIHFNKRTNYFQLAPFLEGHFEGQDEGSQLLGALVKARPQDQVLDYCSGSGGKTLAFAPGMQGKGQIFLHDIRKRALEEAKKRLRRAGVQNAQIVSHDDPRLKKLKGKMDWVLVDAPCSGTGTFRRNPDMKWKLQEDAIERLQLEQRQIFEQALSYLKNNGHIVYATCSLLEEENERQVEYFIKTYGLEMLEELKLLPTSGGPDGFYGVVLKRSIKEEKPLSFASK